MTKERAKRKLSAILSADVKGYSRLMEEDELGTISTLQAYREMITEVIRNYNGRVVDSPGDNLLAEFPSVVDAVECALEIQMELKAKNEELPENRRMEFRIGINLGDVIQEGERIYGDGVNIAARIEGLADAGGICISRNSYEQIKGKLKIGYEYLGEHTLKNIGEPVGVYRVQTEAEDGVEKLSSEIKLPDKPSIAVLPLVSMSEDPNLEYFSDGISDQVIAGLSRSPDLFVISRSSMFTYKGKPVKVQQVSKELGVRYVLEGSVQRSGDQVRISAQLIDANTGGHLWSERYDRDLKDIFALQDEITLSIMSALQVKLTGQVDYTAKGTRNLEAYIKFLKAREHLYGGTPEDYFFARQVSEEAIALDPEYPSPYVVLAWTYMMDAMLGTSKSPRKSMGEAFNLAQKVLAMDESSAGAHALLGNVHLFRRDHEKAIAELEEAVALNPNYTEGLMFLADTLQFTGRPLEAIPLFKKAMDLNPLDQKFQSWCLHGLARAYLDMGQHEESISILKKALLIRPNVWAFHMDLAANYSLLGREEEARAAAAELLRIQPKFSLKHFEKRDLHRNQADRERKITALRKAGLK